VYMVQYVKQITSILYSATFHDLQRKQIRIMYRNKKMQINFKLYCITAMWYFC